MSIIEKAKKVVIELHDLGRDMSNDNIRKIADLLSEEIKKWK